jgi:hypothetical protein
VHIILGFWVLCGIGAAIVASNCGRNGCLWFAIGFILGPIGLALAFVAGTSRRCPACQKTIHPRAIICPYCRTQVGGVAAPVGFGFCSRCGRKFREFYDLSERA